MAPHPRSAPLFSSSTPTPVRAVKTTFAGLILAASPLFAGKPADRVAAAADPQAASAWMQKHGNPENPADLPVTFTMDRSRSANLLKEWKKLPEEKTSTEGTSRRILRWQDPKTGMELRLEVAESREWSVVEYRAFLRNTGTETSPEIRDLRAADLAFPGDSFVLRGIQGDSNSGESYAPYEWKPTAGQSRRFLAQGGKPTGGKTGWPYFNLAGPGSGGRILVLGWPGQWKADFFFDGKEMRWEAGQEVTAFRLEPGEEVRFPSVTLLFWKGDDWLLAQNLWRRWYRETVLPHPPEGRQGATWNVQTILDKSQIPRFQKLLEAGIQPDLCWMDAGGGWWVKPEPRPFAKKDREDASEAFLNTTGFWEPDPAKFPEGFAPFGDWARAQGMKTMLWFEPERIGYTNSAANAYREPVLATRHPDWLMPGGSHGSYFNLGNPEALRWLTDHLHGILRDQKIDWYRVDFNGTGPLQVWQAHDVREEERTGKMRYGLTENFYVQGHLRLWDELRRRLPHLRIDSCAAGGRRNDLESMRRAVPLLRSDYEMTEDADKFEGFQGQTYGLSLWLPFYGGLSRFGDTYEYRSLIMPGFGMHGQSLPVIKKAYDEFRRVAPLMIEGDYYPLTPYNRAPDQWVAWQFHLPEKDAGIVQAFRREKNQEDNRSTPLRGLDPAGRYRIVHFDGPDSPEEKTGEEMMKPGLILRLPQPRSAGIWEYQRIVETEEKKEAAPPAPAGP